jgi:hypothetical protein
MSVEKKTISKAALTSLQTDGEIERLRQDIYRPDREKLHLFTQMLRANALFKKAKVTHKY